MNAALFFLFFVLIPLISPSAFAQRIGHPDESWKTIRTEHFDVVFSARQQDLGLHYAYAAEKAYTNLSAVFPTLPADRIVLIVNDNTDVSNGYATRIPYPHIMAYTVPVNEHDSLSEAGDWARELVTHELTHILQFEPAHGIYSWLRPVFGTIIAPNMLMPLWWKEGMAVEMETQFSPRGRLRSVYQDAAIRSMVQSKTLQLQSLPQANEVLPSWPYGARPYVFGSMFFSQFTADTHDVKASGILADKQGYRVPYFIESPLIEMVGRGYEAQYNSTLRHAESKAQNQLKILETENPSETTHLPFENEYSYNPRYSEKFGLLAFIENTEGETAMAIADQNFQRLELKKNPSGQILSLDFHPAEKKILYSKVDKVDAGHTFADLYLYDIEADKSEQLTFSQRARNPSFSESGEQAVFVTTFAGQTQIRTLDLKTKAVKFILNSGRTERYESPVFWDDNTVLAVKTDADGSRRLVSINLAAKTEKEVPLSFEQIRFLRKKNGALYFVSSKNGVNNIYISKDLVTAVPVTHLLSGTWSYDISGDTAWASVMTGTGFKVEKVKLKEFANALPVIENEMTQRYAFHETEFAPRKFSVSDYEPGSYLWPSYWIPFFSASSSSKGIFLQALTSGHDPVNIHEYSASASYDSELNKGNFSGYYINSVFAIPFKLSTSVYSRAIGSSLDVVQTTTHSVSLLPDMFWLNRNLLFEAGASLQNTNYITDSQHAGPFIQVAYKNYEQTLFQISSENGWGGLLRAEKLYKVSDETGVVARDYEKATFSLIGFANPWLPKHHALKAKLSGLLTFEEVFGRYGGSSSSAFSEEDSLIPQFVVRGYQPAQFFGRSLLNLNLEYRFPVTTLERGSGSDPYFLKKITGAVVADGIAVDGNGLTEATTLHPLKLNESIWSTGLEFKLESTIGYILPMNFVLGYYYPHSPLYASSSQLGLALQIGGF